MDSFDDLLAPSRQALENNPFADHRSGSPDPWATPFATSASENAFGSASDHFNSSETSYGSPTNIIPPPTDDQAPETSDSANRIEEDDDNEPLGNLRSPGFRESVAPITFSETATIRPGHIEEFDAHTPPSSSATSGPSRLDLASEQSDAVSVPTTAHIPEKPALASGASISISDSHAEVPFKSPLEAPFGGIERSIGDLSLGRHSLGGWQSEEETPWQSEQFTPTPITPKVVSDDEDSDDDKPILQAYSKQFDREGGGPPPITRNDKGIQPVFLITVDDPQKVGDPIRSFTMYTVHTRTTSPLYQKSAFSVLRRYSDFLWLYETLSSNNPGVVVPPVPEKNTFGRFDDQFVRQRRLALEKCIQKIANHPVLGRDPDLKLFLESDTFALDIKHRKAELANERGGFIASIGQSITGPRFYETDEWFDRQRAYLDSLESQLRGLVKAIELVAKHRTELAAVTGEFAHNVTELSSSDVGKQLAQSLAGLAEVEKTAQDLQNIQSEQDMTTLMATADEYARLINSVRLAFSSRIRVYHAWKNQENELLKTKQNHERNRAQGKIPTDRLGYSLTQVAEAERRASDAKLEYEQVSKLVKAEVARFEQERIEDFKNALHAFLEGMISRQKELIASWEQYQQMLLKKAGSATPLPVASQPIASSSSVL